MYGATALQLRIAVVARSASPSNICSCRRHEAGRGCTFVRGGAAGREMATASPGCRRRQQLVVRLVHRAPGRPSAARRAYDSSGRSPGARTRPLTGDKTVCAVTTASPRLAAPAVAMMASCAGWRSCSRPAEVSLPRTLCKNGVGAGWVRGARRRRAGLAHRLRGDGRVAPVRSGCAGRLPYCTWSCARHRDQHHRKHLHVS